MQFESLSKPLSLPGRKSNAKYYKMCYKIMKSP